MTNSAGSSTMLSKLSLSRRKRNSPSSNSSTKSEYRRRRRPSATMSFRSMIARIRAPPSRWPSPKTFARNLSNFNSREYTMYKRLRNIGHSHTNAIRITKNTLR